MLVKYGPCLCQRPETSPWQSKVGGRDHALNNITKLVSPPYPSAKVGGTIHSPFSKEPLKKLGLDPQKAAKLAVMFLIQVYKFKFDLQPGSLTDQVAGEHQP